MNKHNYELRKSSRTWYGSMMFNDKARDLKVIMSTHKWEALGQPDSLWVTVEVEGDIHAIQ